MTVIRDADTRRTQTPNATMTTLASPSLGQAALSMWRVDMAAGASGPLHGIDAEQIWTVVEGAASVEIDGEVTDLVAGDTVIIPADAVRRFSSAASDFAAIVVAPPHMQAYPLPGGAKLVPGWVV